MHTEASNTKLVWPLSPYRFPYSFLLWLPIKFVWFRLKHLCMTSFYQVTFGNELEMLLDHSVGFRCCLLKCRALGMNGLKWVLGAPGEMKRNGLRHVEMPQWRCYCFHRCLGCCFRISLSFCFLSQPYEEGECSVLNKQKHFRFTKKKKWMMESVLWCCRFINSFASLFLRLCNFFKSYIFAFLQIRASVFVLVITFDCKCPRILKNNAPNKVHVSPAKIPVKP